MLWHIYSLSGRNGQVIKVITRLFTNVGMLCKNTHNYELSDVQTLKHSVEPTDNVKNSLLGSFGIYYLYGI